VVPGVNNPHELIVPASGVPEGMPSTSQLTPEFPGSLATAAANCCVCPDVIAARCGVTETVNGSRPGARVDIISVDISVAATAASPAVLEAAANVIV